MCTLYETGMGGAHRVFCFLHGQNGLKDIGASGGWASFHMDRVDLRTLGLVVVLFFVMAFFSHNMATGAM